MVYLCVNDGRGGGGGRRGFGGAETWNWPAHATVNVLCYANCPEVQLMLNDKIIGTQKRSEAVNAVLRWEVPFTPGTLRAMGRANGRDVCEFALQTAGSRSRIELHPDTTQLRADARGVAQVEFRIVDARGVRVPNAGPEVKFNLTGPAKIIGIGSGDLENNEDCQGHTHAAFQGRGLLILQTTGTAGDITLQAGAPGLEPAALTLESR